MKKLLGREYAFVGHKSDGTDIYVGWLTHRGAWMIEKYDLSSDSAVTFATGESSMPAAADWPSQSYSAYDSEI